MQVEQLPVLMPLNAVKNTLAVWVLHFKSYLKGLTSCPHNATGFRVAGLEIMMKDEKCASSYNI